jgi:Protein kinase domain
MTDAFAKATAELPTPDELAGYRAVRLLGTGAGGQVYQVRAPNDEPLALKVVPGAAPRTAEDAVRLRRQARALVMIDHPRLVRIHDLAVAGRDLLVVMELLPGPSLQEVLRTRRAAPEEVSDWVTQLAEAIDYLHLLGIVHRDVKPSNILIAAGDAVKLADLGLGDLRPVQGTPTYMAPELVRGDRVVDGRVDVYSLATVAYEGLVGLPPFHVGGPEDVMTAQLRTPPTDPRTHVAGFPAEVGEVLLRGLAKSAEDRPETAGDFAEALATALGGGRPSSSRAIVAAGGPDQEALRTRPAPLPGTGSRAEPLPRHVAQVPLPTRMSRPAMISGLVLIVLAVSVLGYGGYMAYRHLTTPTPFRVTSVAFTSTPTSVRVPTCGAPATFHFHGTVTTNGQAGRLTWEWTQHGVAIQTVGGAAEMDSGHRQLPISQSLRAYYQSDITVPVVLQVTAPQQRASSPVEITYTC